MTTYDGFDDDVRFDRLVDGELNATEYEQLLASLDDHPNGWRQLALTFLEAQAWCSELGAMRKDAEVRSGPAVRATHWHWLPLTLAVAASFSLAFWLGLAWNGTADESGPPQIAGIASSPGASSPGASSPSASSPDSVSDGTAAEQRAASGSGPWGQVTLVMDRDDGSSEEIEVPVYRWGDARTGRAFANSMTIPIELRNALQRAGYQVRRDIRWTPVDIDGGNRVFVPLGEVEITPAVNRAY